MGRSEAHFVLAMAALRMYLQVGPQGQEGRFANHQDQVSICYLELR
jgi:hypothetical protein